MEINFRFEIFPQNVIMIKNGIQHTKAMLIAACDKAIAKNFELEAKSFVNDLFYFLCLDYKGNNKMRSSVAKAAEMLFVDEDDLWNLLWGWDGMIEKHFLPDVWVVLATDPFYLLGKELREKYKPKDKVL